MDVTYDVSAPVDDGVQPALRENAAHPLWQEHELDSSRKSGGRTCRGVVVARQRRTAETQLAALQSRCKEPFGDHGASMTTMAPEPHGKKTPLALCHPGRSGPHLHDTSLSSPLHTCHRSNLCNSPETWACGGDARLCVNDVVWFVCSATVSVRSARARAVLGGRL